MFLFDSLHDGIQHIRQRTYQTWYGGIRTYGVAIATSSTIIGNPGWVVKTYASHISEQGGRSWHDTQTYERICDIVIAHALQIEISSLLPKSVYIA